MILRNLIPLLILVLLTSFAPLQPEVGKTILQNQYKILCKGGNNPPDYNLFESAFNGYLKLKNKRKVKKEILTIIDFRLSGNKKRMWVIDLKHNKILFHCLVAHGRNSGEEFAKTFSNRPQSYQSSLGFYISRSTYHGKHGLSMRMEGIESGINDKAMERAIVMHGAEYVSQQFIDRFGRLGRSFGCPSVPMKDHQQIIKTIENETCIFMYFPDPNYESKSKIYQK